MKNAVSRRDFLKKAGLATSGLVLGGMFPNLSARSESSAKQVFGTNDKVNSSGV